MFRASNKNIIETCTEIHSRGMKLNIDVLMALLLTFFVVSLVAMLFYGEIWQVNLSTSGASAPIDIAHARIAFVFSIIGIASGAFMLYVMDTKFGQDQEKQGTVSTLSQT